MQSYSTSSLISHKARDPKCMDQAQWKSYKDRIEKRPVLVHAPLIFRSESGRTSESREKTRPSRSAFIITTPASPNANLTCKQQLKRTFETVFARSRSLYLTYLVRGTRSFHHSLMKGQWACITPDRDEVSQLQTNWAPKMLVLRTTEEKRRLPRLSKKRKGLRLWRQERWALRFQPVWFPSIACMKAMRRLKMIKVQSEPPL